MGQETTTSAENVFALRRRINDLELDVKAALAERDKAADALHDAKKNAEDMARTIRSQLRELAQLSHWYSAARCNMAVIMARRNCKEG